MTRLPCSWRSLRGGGSGPGYVLAIARMDRIGHRKLQFTGFAVMALCFAVIALVPGMTTMVVPFRWCTG